MILPEVDLLHFGDCPYLGADSTVVQTLYLYLSISIQTLCVIGYQKDHRTKTFWVEH